MRKHIITKDQIDPEGNYIGEVDLSNFDGEVVMQGIGFFKPKNIKARKITITGGGVISGGNFNVDGEVNITI